MKILGLCFLILVLSAVRADSQASPIPTSSRSFSIPFQVRPDASADPAKEIELLVSRDRGARWHSVERKPLDGKQFDFKAETDDEYWFTFRTITLSGNTRQSGAGPMIRVLVDATAPVLTLEMKQQESGQLLVHWKAVETNLQGKRPDFTVSVSSFDREKFWKPLNVDTRHQKASETEMEGRFLFWPENGASEIELRAILTDVAGNRAEKTISTKIKPVNRDIEEIVRDSMAAPEPVIESPDARVAQADLATPDLPNTPIGPFDGPSIPIPREFYGRTETSATPLTPPKPIRISTKDKRKRPSGSKATISDEPLLAREYRPAPSLGTPDGETLDIPAPASPASKTETVKPTSKASPKTALLKTDELSRQLLADMDRFFDGKLGDELKETETAAKKKRTVELVGGPALSPSDPMPSPAPPVPAQAHRAVADNRAEPAKSTLESSKTKAAPIVLPGSITGISMSTAEGQTRIIVKWNPGDGNWEAARVDVLRGATPQGPWLPIATNLPNNGQYWWFLTKDDLTPFHILVRLRGPHEIRNDATPTPISIDPKQLAPSGVSEKK